MLAETLDEIDCDTEADMDCDGLDPANSNTTSSTVMAGAMLGLADKLCDIDWDIEAEMLAEIDCEMLADKLCEMLDEID